MNKFLNKKILILGSNVSSTDIVKYAKSEGAFTIVADYLPPEKSPAKLLADKHILISTADLEKLDNFIKTNHINGVLSGISEFNLTQAMKLCLKNNLPFYCTPKQWYEVEEKDNFRNLCIANHVPCPQTWYKGNNINDIDFDKINYPVVLKPVDSSASMGVYFCQNSKQLKENFKKSLECSSKGVVIVEEFVEGEEFTAHYIICNGHAKLACIDNRYPVKINSGSVTTIPIARIYPSSFTDEYIKQVNIAMLNLCTTLELKDSILFIQGIYNKKNNNFKIFESGLRCAGEAPYRFIKKITGKSFIEILVDHALLGKSDYDITQEDPMLNNKYCGIISLVAKPGKLQTIEGLHNVLKKSNCINDFEQRYQIGAQIPDTNTLRQILMRFILVCSNKRELIREIDYINENINVKDSNNKNMVLKFDSKFLNNE